MKTEKLVGILADRITELTERVAALEELVAAAEDRTLLGMLSRELDRHPELVVKLTEEIT